MIGHQEYYHPSNNSKAVESNARNVKMPSAKSSPVSGSPQCVYPAVLHLATLRSNPSIRALNPLTISPSLLIFRNSVSSSSHWRIISFKASISAVALSTARFARFWSANAASRVWSDNYALLLVPDFDSSGAATYGVYAAGNRGQELVKVVRESI